MRYLRYAASSSEKLRPVSTHFFVQNYVNFFFQNMGIGRQDKNSRPLLFYLPFPTFRKQNFIYFGYKNVET